MNAELIVGLLALAVAGVSTLVSWSTSRRQVQLQERLLTLEHSRERERKSSQVQASLVADLLPSHNHSYRLRVRNDGPGQARAVRVLVDGKTLAESPRVMTRGTPVDTLGPGADVKYSVMAEMGVDPVMRVRLEWVDDTSDSRIWESQLKF